MGIFVNNIFIRNFAALILIFVLCSSCSWDIVRPCPNKVTKVIDGDTIELLNGERVRLIGIDAPEYGEPGFDEAKEELEELVLYRCVELKKGKVDRDKYGRLLRYVYVGGVDVNVVMVKGGLARSI